MLNDKFFIFRGFYLYTLLPFERDSFDEYQLWDIVKDYSEVIQTWWRIDMYVHIPWCNEICTFCHCNKTFYKSEEVEQFLEKMENISMKFFQAYWKVKVSSLWLWGWTPNILPLKEMERLFKILFTYFEFDDSYIRTIELNHLYLDKQKVDLIKQYWFTMVKLPIQTVNLDIVHDTKRYKWDDYIESFTEIYRYIKQVWFTEVSSDMILWLPWSTLEDELNTFNFLKSLDVDNICVFPLQMTTYWKNITNDLIFERYNEIIKRYYDFCNAIWSDDVYTQYNEKVFSTVSFFLHKGHSYLEDKKYHFNHFYKWRSVIWLWPTSVWNVFWKYYYKTMANKDFFLSSQGETQVKRYPVTMRDEMLYYIFYGFDLYWRVHLVWFKDTFWLGILDVFSSEIAIWIKKDILKIEGDYLKIIEKNRYELFMYLFSTFLNHQERKNFIYKSFKNSKRENSK